jgi:hypothetical protein
LKGKLGSAVLCAGIVGTAGLAAYLAVIGPWHRRWGATDDEVARSIPADELAAHANFHTTRAITIQAPVDQVWPWLVQLGQGRGGLYSYDWLENLIKLDLHSADRIRPEFQGLKVGDVIPLESGGDGLRVVSLEPNRLLVGCVDGRLPGAMSALFGKLHAAASWAFLLEVQGGASARLIVRWRARWSLLRSPISLVIGLLLHPIEFIMGQKMMRGIKERAEKG